MATIQLQDIDWAELWQEANGSKKQQKKNSADWDRKAESFATRATHSVYTERFLALLSPRPEWSVLDIGCGPGTLAIPLARRVKTITALDFS
ncbi:MAG: class I SAM-dependent methyltransferase, partial [Desulfobulbus sp.]